MDKNKIKEAVEEFLQKMTVNDFVLEISFSPIGLSKERPGNVFSKIKESLSPKEKNQAVNLDIKISEPRLLIGQEGKTLFDLQRVLRAFLRKKLKENIYLNLDVNDYKKNKLEYLKKLARETAEQVIFTKKTHKMPVMSAYERKIIHQELSQIKEVATQSRGERESRHIVVEPKA